MRYLSVCSGIEAASVAWGPLGWEPWAFAEVDAFPSAVLAHHYPTTPNLGDMSKFQEWPDADVDVLVGGTPCQSFSVAGLRKGLDDPRGGLLWSYLAIARRYRPQWVVWENVPGVLSADDGRAFGSLLGGLAELGYGFAYRVLDAQYFGLAQRRKRVFVVGCLRDWRRAAAVLFERASLSGHPAPRREAGQVAPTVPSRCAAGGGLGTDFDCVAHTLKARFDAGEDGTGRGTPLVPVGVDGYNGALTGDVAATLGTRGSSETATGPTVLAHAFDARQSDVVQYGDQAGPLDTDGSGIGVMTLAIRGRAEGAQLEVRDDGTANAVLTPSGGRGGIGVGAVAFSAKDYGADAGDIAPTLRAGGHTTSHANGGVMPAVAQHMAVRRLTPRECERLQGFPDDYTLIPYRGKPASDGPRYKALGNSFAVNVVRWIGRRIHEVDVLARQA